jgi:hypothetical protein
MLLRRPHGFNHNIGCGVPTSDRVSYSDAKTPGLKLAHTSTGAKPHVHNADESK